MSVIRSKLRLKTSAKNGKETESETIKKILDQYCALQMILKTQEWFFWWEQKVEILQKSWIFLKKLKFFEKVEILWISWNFVDKLKFCEKI